MLSGVGTTAQYGHGMDVQLFLRDFALISLNHTAVRLGNNIREPCFLEFLIERHAINDNARNNRQNNPRLVALYGFCDFLGSNSNRNIYRLRLIREIVNPYRVFGDRVTIWRSSCCAT
jgi:hypothetical protein